MRQSDLHALADLFFSVTGPSQNGSTVQLSLGIVSSQLPPVAILRTAPVRPDLFTAATH